MDSHHFFAAAWLSTRWTLVCRCAGEAERTARLKAWVADRPVAGGSVLLGCCDAGVGVSKLDKELRRLPSPASGSYSFFVERLARRLCRNQFVPAFHFDAVGGELSLRQETRH